MGTYNNPSPTASHAISSTFELFFEDDINRSHSRRLQAYRKYWLYYLGQHWSYSRGDSDPTLTFNYSRRLVDLHNNFAFKKGFKIVIPDDPSTPHDDREDRDFIRVLLEETWRKNDKEAWLLEAAQGGGVTGDVFARVSWDDQNPLEEPHARVDLIPSHFCFPEFGGPHGIHRKQLKRILIINPVFKEVDLSAVRGPFAQRNTKLMAPIKMEMMAEEWLAPTFDPITDEPLSPAKVRYFRNKELIAEKINPLGEIPVVHIPNYPLAGEYYGISDLVDIIDLNKELNEKATDISDIINYHGSPTTVVTGAKIKDLEKGANRVWTLPENASVKNLALEGDLRASEEHYHSVRSALLEISGTTEQSLGNFKGSVPPSGVALQLQFLPLLEKRDVKVMMYGLGIRQINRLILRNTEIADSAFGTKMKALEGNPYRNEIVFPDPLPQDERRELEISKERLAMGISTRRLELEQRGKSQAEIESIIAGADEEAMAAAESLFDVSPGKGKFQLTRGGANETRGEKIIDDTLEDDLDE